MASAPSAPLSALELESTSAEVKRYERQKLLANVLSLVLTLAAITGMALLGGPYLDQYVRRWTGPDNPWLRLIALGFIYAAGLELLTLPLAFWSGFVLEHRYHLSNQTFARWVWRQVKGWLVGGPIGLVLLLGLYALLWYGGHWWWLWAALGWL